MVKQLTDIEIANASTPRPIQEVARGLGIDEAHLETFGTSKAKISLDATGTGGGLGRLVLVTAITPTPAGEGKTTVTVGLGQALTTIGERAAIALREPSLGPCLGLKGGATGGGYSQVLPMEDINLHFTGDLHAVTSAHNLLAALVDNCLHHGTPTVLDPRRVTWRRVLDMNDRALRHVITSVGPSSNGVTRQSGFDITASSEVMAILCLADGIADLKRRLGRIIIGFDMGGEPVTASKLGAVGAMAALLKDAIKPNLVQTIEGTPAFIHGGPFANIAHGTNSLVADKLALNYADYVVTEAGFGMDLGAEKFFNIFSRVSGLNPACVALVATVRALKMHGGVPKTELTKPDPDAVKRGLCNLEHHLKSAHSFGPPVVVCLNRFSADTDEELEVVLDFCAARGQRAALLDVWRQGGAGGVDAARAIVDAASTYDGQFTPTYELQAPVVEKIDAIARAIYGADGVELSAKARRDLKQIDELGLSGLPICIAKTQNSISDDPRLRGRPTGFKIKVREVQVSAGAGFIVPITGTILRMPGLAATPAAVGIDVDDSGVVSGLS